MFGDFGLLAGQQKQFEDVTLGSGKLWEAFSTLFWHFLDQMIHPLMEKLIVRLIMEIIVSCSIYSRIALSCSRSSTGCSNSTIKSEKFSVWDQHLDFNWEKSGKNNNYPFSESAMTTLLRLDLTVVENSIFPLAGCSHSSQSNMIWNESHFEGLIQYPRRGLHAWIRGKQRGNTVLWWK